MLEIIVCDDDKSCRKAVVGIVEQFFTGKQMKYIIHEYGDYNDSFIENIVPGGKKIYILDIETPSRSGIDVARMIRKKDVESIIIFVTGYEEFSRLVLKKNIMCLSFINKFDNLAGDLRESLEESLHFFDTDKVFRIHYKRQFR